MRVLCTSITQHGAVLTVDKTIKLKAATSVLGYEYGDKIALSAADFARLSTAFLDELERRYPATETAAMRGRATTAMTTEEIMALTRGED